MYRLKLERFEGPLDLLLQLIERQELNITDISLASVTEQYLKYLEEQNDLPLEELADFLVVAARLLLLKSRALLPELFVDDDAGTEESLSEQLAIYRRYVEAGRYLARRLHRRHFFYARERLPLAETSIFSPPANLTTAALRGMFIKVLENLAEFVRPIPELISRAVSLQDKIASLRRLLEGGPEVDFRHVLKNAKSRMEMIVCFLALLELMKQRYVLARQEGRGASIVLVRVDQSSVGP